MSLTRLIPRSRKTATLVAASALLLLLTSIAFAVFYQKTHTAVREVNYTQLRDMAEARGATSVKIDGD